MDNNYLFSSTLSATVDNMWTPWCYTSPAEYIVVLHFIFFPIAMFTAIFGVYSIYKITTLSIQNIVIKILFIIINITFVVSSIAYIIHLVMGLCCMEYEEWAMVGIVGVNCYQYGVALLYLLYLIRLLTIFQADVMTQKLFGIPNTFFVIVGMGAFMVQFVLPSLSTYYFEIPDWTTAVMLINIFTCVNAIFSLYVLCLFCKKVRQLGKKTMDEDSNVILSPAIQYALCAFITFISSQFVNIVSIYRAYVQDTDFWLSLHITLLGIDQMINLVCLFLQFKFGRECYFKYFGSIHSFVESKVVRKISKAPQNIRKRPEKIEFDCKGSSTTGATVTTTGSTVTGATTTGSTLTTPSTTSC